MIYESGGRNSGDSGKGGHSVNGRQLVLDVGLHEINSFENFIAGNNQLVVEFLRDFAEPTPKEFCCFLYGAHGSGKTHLLSAVLNRCEQAGKRCAYYPLSDCESLDPRMLLSELQPEILCIDDLQVVLGDAGWECALFECYNRRQALNLPIIITSQNSLHDSIFLLQDLKSRFTAGLIFKLKSMSDDERFACLQYRADQRGLTLPPAVARFLLERYARDNHTLLSALDRLDQASIEERRALTIPFVKQVLSI